jgi:hypothetical protein
MILLYTHTKSPRLLYIVDVIFNQWLQTEYKITTDKNYFLNTDAVKIDYSDSDFDKQFEEQIIRVPKNTHLLFENEIKKQNLHVGEFHGIKTLFHSQNNHADLPFDLFAAIFWLITRYEEYFDNDKDEHQRFKAENSWAYQHKVIEKPIVNYWLVYFKEIVKNKYPRIKFNEQKFQFIDTIDVDNAFAFKGKGFARNMGGLVRDLKNLPWLKKRIKVLLGSEPDPFDTFNWHIQNTRSKKISKQIYFFLVGNYGKFDKNVPFDYPLLKSRIQFLKENNVEIGLHPSYLSNDNFSQLKIEKERLELLAQSTIKSSRQHFLKLQFPSTYQNLVNLGIKNDFTLGYAELPGFRAGVCLPFTFFNLQKNIPESLTVFPLTAMDATFRYYLNYTPEETIKMYLHLINEVKKVNGTFVGLWHNDAFSNTENWVNWQKVYTSVINAL